MPQWAPVGRAALAAVEAPPRHRCHYGTGMGDADAYDEFGPPDSTGEDDPIEPLEIVPCSVPIEAYDPDVGGGSVVRLFFQPGDRGAAPDVDSRRW